MEQLQGLLGIIGCIGVAWAVSEDQFEDVGRIDLIELFGRGVRLEAQVGGVASAGHLCEARDQAVVPVSALGVCRS